MSCVSACMPPNAERPNCFTNDHQDPRQRGQGAVSPGLSKYTRDLKTQREIEGRVPWE